MEMTRGLQALTLSLFKCPGNNDRLALVLSNLYSLGDVFFLDKLSLTIDYICLHFNKHHETL